MNFVALVPLSLLVIQGCVAAQTYRFPERQPRVVCAGWDQDCSKQLECCSETQSTSSKCRDCGLAGAWVVKQAQLLGYVFTDFSGRRFKFSGEDDESYNLFTEADHQLNAIVSNRSPHAWQLGITLRGVGIHGPDTHVKIGSSAEGLLSLEVNERIFREQETRLDGVIIERECVEGVPGNSTCQNVVRVFDRFLSLTAWIATVNGGDSGSIAFNLTLTEHPMSQVHGILGQSLEDGDNAAAVSMPSNLQFYGEGQLSDYSTTDLFSSDSTFSIFTRKAERRRHRRKRQMLEGNALASMAFAAKAESGALALADRRMRFPKVK